MDPLLKAMEDGMGRSMGKQKTNNSLKNNMLSVIASDPQLAASIDDVDTITEEMVRKVTRSAGEFIR
jgi:hypothetical protein